MTDQTSPSVFRPEIPGFTAAPPEIPENKFAEEALARHKREGLELAVRARIIAMAIIAVLVLWIVPWPSALFYEVIIAIFVLIGLAQRRYGRVGQNRIELVLLFCDLLLLLIAAIVPNPFDDRSWPLPFQYQFDTFLNFFVILAIATLAYSWRTIIAVGTWTFAMWMIALAAVAYFADQPGQMRAAVLALYPDGNPMAEFLDPTNVLLSSRITEAVTFLIVAVTLAISVRRFNNLTLRQAAVERERANLARYFSPNVVEELSNNDDPLKQIRTQDIAVLFVDIVGFTTFAAERSPEAVITTLREFHGRMEACVFQHHGTLDKYLGDGLMATFGTPSPGPKDAVNALKAAQSMAMVVEDWNRERAQASEPPIIASFGLHFGPVVVGDIGANRLEYAVIGNTVNVASRLEALSRPLGVRIVASEALVIEAKAQGATAAVEDLHTAPPQNIRGIDGKMAVWTQT
ncbi:MAG: adenylate/guanylate cyclase domain-containing protein [Pseudomonadota bacterium]